MKRKMAFSMKWKLVAGVVGVLLPVGVALWLVFHFLISSADERLFEVLKDRSLANARQVSNAVGFEMAAGLREEIAAKLRHVAKEDKEVHFLAVLGADTRPLVKTGADVDLSKLLPKVSGVDKGRVFILEHLVVAVVPIVAEQQGDALGYILYTESLEEYFAFRRQMLWLAIGALVIGLGVIAGVVYVLGHATTVPVLRLVSTAERIADGDLENLDVETGLGGTTETNRLALSIGKMGEALQRQVLAIKNLTAAMSEMSKGVASAVANLASGASQQASAVTETATTVDELERTGKSTAGNAGRIVEAAEKTAEVSMRGRKTVKTTNDIVVKIRQDSQDISEKSSELLSAVEEVENIIDSVKGIAEQSKILAVNASIEAAKAGEYGAGFAVVAQEVKDLAQQSKDATLQITASLTAIRQAIETMVTMAASAKQRTEEGVAVIANAGAIMNDLSEAIQENSEFANVIAANIKQQAVGLTQIATAVEEINSAAVAHHKISRDIEESSAKLTAGIEKLVVLVSKWRIPDDMGASSTASGP